MKIKAFTLFIVAFSVNLYAEAFFAGSINSVNADSGFNALRNPALMSAQDKDSAGFSYMFLSDVYNDISGKIDNVLLTDGKIEATSNEKYNGTMSLSYVNRFSGGAFGLGIRKPEGTDQMAMSESTFTVTGAYAPASIAVKDETNEENKTFTISSVFSLSKDLGRNESFGIQFETGISDSTSEKEKSGYGFAVVDYNMEISTMKLIGNMNFGYYHKSDKYEIGAIIKLGEYIYEKQDYSYEDNSTSDKKSSEVSPYFYQNKGIEYTLGYGCKIINGLSFNMEMNLGLPFDKDIEELKDDDNGIMAENNSTTYVKYSGILSGGFDYRYDRNVKLGLGGGAGIYSADVAGSDGIKTGQFKYNVYSVITGVEVTPAERVKFLFGLHLYLVDINQNYESAFQSLNLEIQTLYLNVIAGASMFY